MYYPIIFEFAKKGDENKIINEKNSSNFMDDVLFEPSIGSTKNAGAQSKK